MVQILSRKWYLLSRFVLLVWLAILASQTSYTQRHSNCELSVYGSLKIDVCGSENQKRFILVMSIGNVTRRDSLFGFNFQLSYDNNKVRITDALYLNTLSEFFDNKNVFINSKEGKVYGYAITMGMEPIYGNRPLLALNGLWISQCPDTCTFTVDYIEFTNEFKIIIDTLKPAKLVGEIFYSSDRFFEISILPDTLKFEDNKGVIDLNIRIPKNSRLTNYSIIGVYDPDMISFDSITSLSDNIRIEDYEHTNNLVRLFCKNLYDIADTQKIRFYINFMAENNFTIVVFYPEYDLTCKCLSGYKTDSVSVVYIKETSLLTEEKNHIDIDKCYVYDVMGRLVNNIDVQSNYSGFRNGMHFLNRGIYYVICRDKFSKIIERKIYVNY
ncbi:MAG: hypothetical protein ACK42Z_07995 [Candidatus Kapaibacteriota bacterium]